MRLAIVGIQDPPLLLIGKLKSRHRHGFFFDEILKRRGPVTKWKWSGQASFRYEDGDWVMKEKNVSTRRDIKKVVKEWEEEYMSLVN